jgi:hypothetical protein
MQQQQEAYEMELRQLRADKERLLPVSRIDLQVDQRQRQVQVFVLRRHRRRVGTKIAAYLQRADQTS